MPLFKDEPIPAPKAPSLDNGGDKKFIPYIQLKDDGDEVRILFITDYPDMFWSKFHRRLDEDGNFRGHDICPRAELGEECDKCGEEGNYAQTQWLAWVWDADAEQVKLMRYPTTHQNAVKRQYDKNGTVVGVEYIWVRAGPRNSRSVSYLLEVEGKGKLPAGAKIDLPSLEDVAWRRVNTLDGDNEAGETVKKTTTKKKKVVANTDDDAIPSDDEDLPF